MKYYILLIGVLFLALGEACKPGTAQKKDEETTARDIPSNPDNNPTPQENPQPSDPTPAPIQDPPTANTQSGEEDNLEHLRSAASEFNELSRPKSIKSWVTGLRVKAYPGDEYEHLTTLKENETAEYLYQRTVRRSEYRFRGQKLEDNWYLVKTQSGVVGWVHGGGIKFIDEGGKEVAANARTAGDKSDADKVENDWTFVPGKRIGKVRYNTTEEDLVKLFGFDNIKRGQVETAAGSAEPCTYIYKDEANEVAITWKNQTRTRVKAVYLNKYNSKWHSPEGLKMGQPLQDLAKINEAPIAFYGFDWEYSGTIEKWGGGELHKYSKYFYVVLDYDASKSSKEYLAKMKSPKLFSSNTETARNVGIYVKRIVVYLD